MSCILERLSLQNCTAKAIGCQNANLPITSIQLIQAADSQPTIGHKAHKAEIAKQQRFSRCANCWHIAIQYHRIAFQRWTVYSTAQPGNTACEDELITGNPFQVEPSSRIPITQTAPCDKASQSLPINSGISAGAIAVAASSDSPAVPPTNAPCGWLMPEPRKI